MKRRDLVTLALSSGLGIAPPREAFAGEDTWGANDGYPIGWGSPARFTGNLRYRVGNFSGGFAALMPHNTIRALAPAPLQFRSDINIRYNYGFSRKGPAEYLAAWPITGLLIARKGAILYEGYGMGRDAEMTLTSMSMAKSVTSLLVGLCIDQGKIVSIEDVAEKYVPALKDSLHGQTTLRNLMNMSSGAAIEHARDNNYIYPSGLRNANSSVLQTVQQWNARNDLQGTAFNYNELCALTMGLVIRAVTGTSLSEFAEKYLWTPLGAEGEATWLLDSQGVEFNCIGLGARLRDWAKLGQLVAQQGRWKAQQVISRDWMEGYSKWTKADGQVRPGVLKGKGANQGYKFFIWHDRSDGSRPTFSGAYGQHVFVDLPTQTVLVQTCVTDESLEQKRELGSLFQAAVEAS